MGEVLQTNLDAVGAHVVKAFTTIPMEHFALAPEKLRAAKAQTFLADGGRDGSREAKTGCQALVEQLGFEAVDLGSGLLAMRMSEMMGDVMRYFLKTTGRGLMTSLVFQKLPNPTSRNECYWRETGVQLSLNVAYGEASSLLGPRRTRSAVLRSNCKLRRLDISTSLG